jgi:hypothetical protein
MGQIENMTQKDVEDLQAMVKAMNEHIGREIPVTLKTFPMDDLDFSKRLSAIEDKLDKLLLLIGQVFKEIKIPK